MFHQFVTSESRTRFDTSNINKLDVNHGTHEPSKVVLESLNICKHYS